MELGNFSSKKAAMPVTYHQQVRTQSTMANRRNFSRITDDVLLRYRKVAVEEDGAESREWSRFAARFELWEAISEVTQKPGTLLHRMRARSHDTVDYLALVEAHLGMLSKTLFMGQTGFSEEPDISLDLGAGGIAFSSCERFEPGETLDLQLVILPTLTAISVRAVILRCELSPRGNPTYPHRIAVTFQGLKEQQRDQIVKYVLRRQILARRRCSAGATDSHFGPGTTTPSLE